MNNQHDDQPFEDPTLSALYRQGATEQPDPAMDELILQMAKKEQKPRRRNNMLFGVPLSAAAMVLVAVGIVRLVMQEAPLTDQGLEEAMAPSEPEPVMEAPSSPVEKKAVREKLKKPTMEEAKEMESGAVMDSAPAGLMQSEPRLQSSPPPAPAAAKPYRMQKSAPVKMEMGQQREGIPGKQENAEAEKLLATIRELVAANQIEEARKKLLELRQRYPEYPIPADVKALLEPVESK